ncbi:hypothetical protein KY289_022447 [Solanum tuberosum]|nr:hypothetical protein KY289_022447 [Solanum tuberosum]
MGTTSCEIGRSSSFLPLSISTSLKVYGHHAKRFESLASLNSAEGNKGDDSGFELIISQLETRKRADATVELPPSPRSMTSIAPGNLVIRASGQSSYSPATQSSPLRPTSFFLVNPTVPLTTQTAIPLPNTTQLNVNPPLLPLQTFVQPETPNKPFKAKISFLEFNISNPRG